MKCPETQYFSRNISTAEIIAIFFAKENAKKYLLSMRENKKVDRNLGLDF